MGDVRLLALFGLALNNGDDLSSRIGVGALLGGTRRGVASAWHDVRMAWFLPRRNDF